MRFQPHAFTAKREYAGLVVGHFRVFHIRLVQVYIGIFAFASDFSRYSVIHPSVLASMPPDMAKAFILDLVVLN